MDNSDEVLRRKMSENSGKDTSLMQGNVPNYTDSRVGYIYFRVPRSISKYI